MEQDLMAFWTDTRPPYYVGSKIEQFEDDGRVRTAGFPGYLFRPVLVVPLSVGQAMKDKLRKLDSDHSLAVEQAKHICRQEADKLLGLNQE